MFAICIESSHDRGMGHFYRALNLANYFLQINQPCILYINDHEPSIDILNKTNLPYRIIDLTDCRNNWESHLIKQDKINIWINDRLDTDIIHAKKIKATNIPLVTFDDRGSGADLADINIVGLSFNSSEKLPGIKVLRGLDYLILNPTINSFKRLRNNLSSILVTLGGSDTYGVTVKVVEFLKAINLKATILVGPAFIHIEELNKVLNNNFILKNNVFSMIEEFHYHDLAITGGGITPFEANASGLPCIVIANEIFEVPIGEALEKLGGSTFAGYHKSFLLPNFISNFPLEEMSCSGMKNIDTLGVERVTEALMKVI